MSRAAEDSESGYESSAPKRAKTGAGGGGMAKGGAGKTNSDQQVNPIPRNLSTQSVTLNFVQRTWEEIGPGELKYLPLCQTIRYMFDKAMIRQFNKFKGLWSTMEVHQPHARISNLIMLQDDLINQGGTPLETTAFTQACYMLTYRPSFEDMCFQLGDQPCDATETVRCKYQLAKSCSPPNSRLIKIEGYTDFEQLSIHPYKRDVYAGPEDTTTSVVDRDYSYDYPYVHPIVRPLNVFSGNLQAENKFFVKPFNTVTFSRNTDKIALHKYGDTVEIPINTNLNGKRLLNNEFNEIFANAHTTKFGNVTVSYDTEWSYPGYNRPYFIRKDGLDVLMPTLNLKDLKSIPHTFLTMPPIKKANNALLKQRCSFILEQEVSITFNFIQSVFPDPEIPDDNTDQFFLAANDGIILRPNFYGQQDASYAQPFCPKSKMQCIPGPCPFPDSFAGLIQFIGQIGHWVDTGKKMQIGNDTYSCYNFNSDPAGKFMDIAVDLGTPAFVSNHQIGVADFITQSEFQKAFSDARVNGQPVFYVSVKGLVALDENHCQAPFALIDENNKTLITISEGQCMTVLKSKCTAEPDGTFIGKIKIDLSVLDAWMADDKIVCSASTDVMRSSANREAHVFFC